MTLDLLVRALDAKKRGLQYWAHCPVHEADGKRHRPSLALTERNGKILLHCWAGCSQKDIIEALTRMQLWDRRPVSIWDTLRARLDRWERQQLRDITEHYIDALDPVKLSTLEREDWAAYERVCRRQGEALKKLKAGRPPKL